MSEYCRVCSEAGIYVAPLSIPTIGPLDLPGHTFHTLNGGVWYHEDG